jgi:hypothetical protein
MSYTNLNNTAPSIGTIAGCGYSDQRLAQNDIILLFMSISKGYLPSSPYIIYDGVVDIK